MLTREDFIDLRTMQNKMRACRYAKLLADWPTPVGFELVTATVDDYGQAIFGRWGGWWLGINEMLVNERITLWLETNGRTEAPNVPSYGWCYPKGGTVLHALATFDPAQMGEPAGFAKRVFSDIREPGETADDFVQSKRGIFW